MAEKSQDVRSVIKKFSPEKNYNEAGVVIDSDNNLSDSKSLFAFHPHGIFAIGFLLSSLLNETLERSHLSGSRGMLYMPFTGIFVKLFGIEAVNHSRFKKLMEQGENISFIPGGYEEATITSYNKDRVYIKKRKGFIKYALEYGYKIHPVYTFNENKLFYNFNFFEKARLWMNKFKIPGVFIYGKKYFLFPNNEVKLITVVGEGIQLPTIINPSKKDIDTYHEIYVDALKDLYNKHKFSYGGSENLEIL